MENQEVDKAKLLAILKGNREKHKAVFDEAMVGYKQQVTKLLKEHLMRVQAGKNVRVHIVLTQPVNQTKSYDRVIGMLEMALANEVELSEEDYQQYVMDDWSWKEEFLTSNARYSSTASAMLGE
jgi:hypothetical protein